MADDLTKQTKRKRGRPAGLVEQRLTIAEVAAALSVPVQTVYAWTRQAAGDGKPVLPVEKLGRFVRVRASAVERLSERLASRPAVSFFTSGGKGVVADL